MDARPFAVAEAYSPADIAGLMCCSPATVRRLIDGGRIRGFNVPGRQQLRRVLHADLEAYLRSVPTLAPILERFEEVVRENRDGWEPK